MDKKIINFDLKYRPEIESGKFSLITRDHRQVDIDVWEDPAGDERSIAAMVWKDRPKAKGDMFFYYPNGRYNKSKSDHKLDLFIITDEDSNLSEFETYVEKIMGPGVVPEDVIKSEATKLLALGAKYILPK